jgi:hypothetical protein
MASAAKIANFLVTAGETLKGAGGDKVTTAGAGAALLKSLVSSIKSDSDGVIDLADKTLLKAVINDSATEVAKTVTGTTSNFAAKITTLADTFANVMKDATDNITAAVTAGGSSDAFFTNIGNVAKFTQTGAAEKLQEVAKTLDPTSANVLKDLASIETTLTGDAADKSISTGSTVVTPPVVTPPVVADTTVAIANDNYNGTFQTPVLFDASVGNGVFVFNDSATLASFTRITNFGNDDSINITGGGSNKLIVANNGADVVLTVNNNGVVSQITLVSVTSPSAIISSIGSFNALPVGNVSYTNSNGVVSGTPVTTNLDSLSGTILSAATFNAVSGAQLFAFTDSATTSSYTTITNFNANDSINFSDVGSNHLIVANNGADVVLTVNDNNGHVSQITLVGVASPSAVIGSLSDFNALGVGSVTFS